MVALANIPDVPNAVTPVSGGTYAVQNLAYYHWLDNSYAHPSDGNPIISWVKNSPETNNQIWTYLTYPSSDGDTIFTLQDVSTTDDDKGFGGRGGYMSVDPETGKLVQRGAPTAWKLLETADSIYKMVPFDDFLSANGSKIATDVNSVITSVADNQAELLADASELTQLWAFNPIDPA